MAVQHYLQLTHEHFERATEAAAAEGAQAAQKPHETGRNDVKPKLATDAESAELSEDFAGVPVIAGHFTAFHPVDQVIHPEGFAYQTDTSDSWINEPFTSMPLITIAGISAAIERIFLRQAIALIPGMAARWLLQLRT